MADEARYEAVLAALIAVEAWRLTIALFAVALVLGIPAGLGLF